MARPKKASTRQDIHKALADLVKRAQAQGMKINTYGPEGCLPCNATDAEDSCLGCPHRLEENGVKLW